MGYKNFRDRCGSGFINQIDRGGRFLAYVKFKFADKSVKNSFKFSGSYGQSKIKIDASVEALSEQQRRNSYAEIDIYMEGGNLASFEKVLSDFSPVECQLDKWEDCKAVIKNIIKYSSSIFPADVASGHTRNLNFSTSPYPVSRFNLDPDYLAARKELASEAQNQVGYQLKVEDILNLKAELLSESRREKLNDIEKSIRIWKIYTMRYMTVMRMM